MMMVAQFDRRNLFAAYGIAAAIAAVALSMAGLPGLFDFAQAGPTSHVSNPRHDPAAFKPRAYNPRANVFDPLYDETEMDERHSGQH
jgi:hypothetical protein